MQNFSTLVLWGDSNIRPILRNPRIHRQKLMSFQSSTRATHLRSKINPFEALYSLKIKYFWLRYFNRLAITLPKESYNSHWYLKRHKNLLVSPSRLLIILLRVNWCLPWKNGWDYRVKSMTSSQNEKNMALPVTRTPISGYLKVPINAEHDYLYMSAPTCGTYFQQITLKCRRFEAIVTVTATQPYHNVFTFNSS